jgi:hypothetical protein
VGLSTSEERKPVTRNYDDDDDNNNNNFSSEGIHFHHP